MQRSTNYSGYSNGDKITGYKIVKYCRSCRQRFTVSKGESKKNFCNACLSKLS